MGAVLAWVGKIGLGVAFVAQFVDWRAVAYRAQKKNKPAGRSRRRRSR